MAKLIATIGPSSPIHKPGDAQRVPVKVELQRAPAGEYLAVTYPGENPSGIEVFGTHVLVRMDPFAPVTSGGIMWTDAEIERKTAISVTGCVYAIGGAAFTHFTNGMKWAGPRPEVGDRVFVEQYAGIPAQGADGNAYRVMEYTCVAGRMTTYGIQPGVGEKLASPGS